jgi:hypothetical protein
LEMLNQRSILDIPKGAAMVKGWSFRATARLAHSSSPQETRKPRSNSNA